MEKFYKVKCINASESTNLVKGANYYVFPISETNPAAYISRFPRELTHFGCYQLSRFERTEEDVIWDVTAKPRRTMKMDNEIAEESIETDDFTEATEEKQSIEDGLEPALLVYKAIFKTMMNGNIKNPYLYIVVETENAKMGAVYEDAELKSYLGSLKLESLELTLLPIKANNEKFKKGMPLNLTYGYFFNRTQNADESAGIVLDVVVSPSEEIPVEPEVYVEQIIVTEEEICFEEKSEAEEVYNQIESEEEDAEIMDVLISETEESSEDESLYFEQLKLF